MKPIVSIIMGSTSDLPVMEKAMKWLEDQEIPFEVNALSAHRTPDAVEEFAKNAKSRGIARRYCCVYTIASNRCAYQGRHPRRFGCCVLYPPDASWHSCSYSQR